jgi:SAM-dependent MidA family methyltransferase
MMTPLQEMIVERIRRDGPLTFADYMRMALYEPGYGYYVSGSYNMGWQGDYFTSADVFDLFAYCLGRQLLEMWERLRRPVPFVVLEQGAGRGKLAEGVRAWARRDAPDLFDALDYRLADLHSGQDALDPVEAITASLPPPPDTHKGYPYMWDDPTPAPDPMASVILSNELVDAFPVHVVEAREGRLYEVYVDTFGAGGTNEGGLREVLGELSSPEVASYLDRFRIPWGSFPDGWRAEINLDAARWMERCAQMLRRGFLFAIDYGEKARTLYTRERRRGTLLCYRNHSTNERPLAYPGEQDITAHVNFSALIEEGRRHGLRLQSFTTQREWLKRMGLYEELERRRARDFAPALADRASDQGQIALLQWYSLRQGVSLLTNPAAMGNFKALVMRR